MPYINILNIECVYVCMYGMYGCMYVCMYVYIYVWFVLIYGLLPLLFNIPALVLDGL